MAASAIIKELTSGHQKLTAAWKKKDTKSCKAQLDQLRLQLTHVAFMPTEGDLQARRKELLLARDVLEIGAHASLADKDVEAFERYVAQLKVYYADYPPPVLPESEYKYELLGLDLLCLLSQNRTADFHAELERLPADAAANNAYIRCPVRLEQFVMEGGYNKVLMMRDNVPAQSYAFFVDKLLSTIREEIASCMEKAYDQMSVKDCAKMLQLDQRAASKLIQEREWPVEKGVVLFSVAKQRQNATAMEVGENGDGAIPLKLSASSDKAGLVETAEVPTEELARMAITYAREMEQII